MRKLIIVGMIALLAGLTHAASFNWATDCSLNATNPDPGDLGYTSPNVTFQLVAYGATDPTGLVTPGGWDYTTSSPAGTAASGTMLSWTSGSYDYDYGYAGFTYSAPEAEINQWYAVFIWDEATPDYYGVSVFKIEDVTEKGGSGSFAAGTTNADAFEAVPEPTSVALLLMGVAAIGLRRRFRG